MWRTMMAAGVVWVLATVWLGVVLLDRAAGAADEGLIPEPGNAQMVVAVMSIVIFGLPGVVLVMAGWRRRPGA